MIALHMGGIPELAMFLGPILLIAAFVRIARRKEAGVEDDDWDADLGDLPVDPDRPPSVRRTAERPKNRAL
ncbi:hypothetical protein [Kribbella italica]|uniref:Uncharacterized protein n=1 Tax=Kribbella italica TaxID=1540520 RepID=A0A7W9JG51_9ACTN|nr:hypothetical protein [Kribbella italica]MBB5841299.1 hypothetical protein [Kribbella italica]